MNINRVNIMGMAVLEADTVLSDLATVGNSAHIVLLNTGILTVNDGTAPADGAGVAAHGDGNVSLVASAGIVLNADAQSTSGSIEIDAQSVLQNAGADLRTGDGTIRVRSATGIDMADTATARTTDRNISYTAANDIRIGSLNAGQGDVSVTAGGAIIDGGESLSDIVADDALLSANGDIGAATDKLDLDTTTAAAESTTAGIFLNADPGSDLQIDAVAFSGVDLVNDDGSLAGPADAGALAGLASGNNGPIVAVAADGSLTVNRPVSADGSGNVLLMTMGTANDIVINDTVQSGSGSIEADASGTLAQNAEVRTTGGDIRLEGDGVVQTDGTRATTAGGDILVDGRATGVAISRLDSAGGNIAVDAAGDITDAGDALPDIVSGAGDVRLRSTAGSVGESTGNALLETTIGGNLAARAGDDGIFIDNQGDTTVGDVAVTVDTVNMAGLASAVADPNPISDLATTANDADIVLRSAGDIRLTDGTQPADGLAVNADGAGNILLDASGDITFDPDTDVQTGSGAVDLHAGGDIVQQAGSDVRSGGGSIAATAQNVAMDDTATAQSGGGDIRYEATIGNVTVGSLNSAAGDIAVVAANRIVDGGETLTDLVGNDAVLVAANGIGAPTDKLDTELTALAAEAGTPGMFLNERAGGVGASGDLAIDAATVSGVDSVNPDGSTTALAPDTRSGLVADGPIVQAVEDGDLTVNQAVIANIGNILLATMGAANDITLNADTRSSAGHISVNASGDINQNANLETGGAGTIEADAGGDIRMAANTRVRTAGGNIRANAGGDIDLSLLDAAGGDVSLIAAGAINDLGTTPANTPAVLADELRIEAGSVGADGNVVDIDVNTLAAIAAGRFDVLDANDLTVGTIGDITVQRVNMDNTLTPITDTGLTGLQGQNAVCVTANDDLLIMADVTSGGLDLVLAGDMDADNNGDLVVVGPSMVRSQNGDIFLFGQTVDLQSGSTVDAGSGGILLQAIQNANLNGTLLGASFVASVGGPELLVNGQLTFSDTVVLHAFAGSIVGSGRVTANALSMNARNDIGRPNDLFNINVSQLAALTQQGSTYIESERDTTLASIGVPNFFIPVPDCVATRYPAPQIPAIAQMESARDIVFTVNGNLDGDLVDAGGNAQVDVRNNANVNTINTGGNLDIDTGGNLDFANGNVGGNLDADVGGNLNGQNLDVRGSGTIDVRGAGQLATTTVGGNLDLNTGGPFDFGAMTIGQNLTAGIGGGIDGDQLTVGNDADITAGGPGNIRDTDVTGNLRLQIAGPFDFNTVDVGRNLDADIGGDLRGQTLSVGGDGDIVSGPANISDTDVNGSLRLRTRGPFDFNTVDVRGNLDADIGGSLQGNQLTIGGNAVANVSGGANVRDTKVGGTLDLRTGGPFDFNQVMANGNFNGQIGGTFNGNQAMVGGNTDLDISSSATVRDLVDVRGDLDLDTGGTYSAPRTQVGGSLRGNVRGDVIFSDITVNGRADLTAGGNLAGQNFRSGGATLNIGRDVNVSALDINGPLLLNGGGNLVFDTIRAAQIDASMGGTIDMSQVDAGGAANFSAGGSIVDRGSRVAGSSVSLVAGGDVGGPGAKINIDTPFLNRASGGNIHINQLRPGTTTLGFIDARNLLELCIRDGSLADGNGDALNIQAKEVRLDVAGTIGSPADPLDVNISDTLTLLGGQQVDQLLWAFFQGDLGQRPILFGGPDLEPRGIGVINGSVDLINSELRSILQANITYGDDLIGFKFKNSIFGDFYFLHLYMQISELADDLDLNTIDYLLSGRALVSPDPELPAEAKDPVIVGQ